MSLLSKCFEWCIFIFAEYIGAFVADTFNTQIKMLHGTMWQGDEQSGISSCLLLSELFSDGSPTSQVWLHESIEAEGWALAGM